jgi:anti-anti-sigma factor
MVSDTLSRGGDMAKDSLHVSTEETGSSIVIRCAGEIDLNTSPELQTAITSAIDRKPGRLHIDATRIGFMGAEGIRVLIESAERCEAEGIQLAVHLADKAVRLLKLLHIEDKLPLKQGSAHNEELEKSADIEIREAIERVTGDPDSTPA